MHLLFGREIFQGASGPNQLILSNECRYYAPFHLTASNEVSRGNVGCSEGGRFFACKKSIS